MSPPHSDRSPVTPRRVLALWWPLASSWLLMALEMPMLVIAMTRMPGGEPHLAAMGALVYPLSILIEGPIIMLLAASTALVRDLVTHERLRRFTHALSAVLTLLHILVAFTPLYDFIAVDLIGAPAAAIEPGRLGMQIMTPWTWAIAYRRFQQGVLIHCGRSDLVMGGTIIRLAANALVLSVGLSVGTWPGIVVGASGVAFGVVAEAIWAGSCFHRTARPILAGREAKEPISWRAFAAFYVPLAFTPIITIIIQPIGAWAMGRMAEPVMSMAAWTAVHGLVFLMRSTGFAFNEVVVTLAGAPGGMAALRRCGILIGLCTTCIILLLALTPLGGMWFSSVSGMSDELTQLSCTALFFAVLMPGYAVAQNYHQGVLVHSKRTRPITEAVVLYMVICCSLLWLGVELLDDVPGIYVALASFTIAGLTQTVWLHWRRHSTRL